VGETGSPTLSPTDPPLCAASVLQGVQQCTTSAGQLSNPNNICTYLFNMVSCIPPTCSLPEPAATTLSNLQSIYAGSCVQGTPSEYEHIGDGRCKDANGGSLDSEVQVDENQGFVMCNVKCNLNSNCLGFTFNAQVQVCTLWLEAPGSVDTSVNTGGVIYQTCWEKITDKCVASDCNDKGTASGRGSDEGGCQCTCQSGFTGDSCETELKVKTEVGIRGTTKADVEANEQKYKDAIAVSLGVSNSTVTIISVTERQVDVRRRRLVVTEVIIDYEVEVNSVQEKNDVVTAIEDESTFKQTLQEDISDEGITGVTVEYITKYDPCSRITDCSSHGSTTDADSRDGCMCTCDVGWDVEPDCSVAATDTTTSTTEEADASKSDEDDEDIMVGFLIAGGMVLVGFCLCVFFLFFWGGSDDEEKGSKQDVEMTTPTTPDEGGGNIDEMAVE